MKLQRLLGALCAGLMLISLPVGAAEQSSYVTPPTGPMPFGTFVGTYLNPALRSLASCSWGSSAPVNGPSGAALPYQCWADTTTNPVVFKFYDGASWVVAGKLNTSTHLWTPSRQGTDLGTASIATTGTSGHAVPFLDGANTWSGAQTFGAVTLGGTVSGGGNQINNVVIGASTIASPVITGTVTGAAVREKLTAARTYYVLTTGSDSNTGLANTSGGAFQTVQKAVDVLLNNIDLNGFNATIDITGAYTAGVIASSPFVGKGTVTLTSSAGASITTTGGHAIVASGGCYLTVNGSLTLSTVTSGVALMAVSGGYISTSGVTFGASATGHIAAGWNAPGFTGPGTVNVTGNYSITGGAGSHWHVPVDGSSIIAASGTTVTLTGTPAFTNFFMGITKGLVYAPGVTFSGTATGPKYLIHNSGTFVGLTRTAIPGSIAGTVNSGGLFTDPTIVNEDSDLGVSHLVGQNFAAPSAPATGYTQGWFDSTDKRFHDKNDAGTIGTTVIADTGAANNFLTGISIAGVPSKAQPSLSNLSGYGAGVLTALGTSVGSTGAPVVNGGALGSPSSVGTLPAHTLGGAVSGGGNQINNVVIGASTPLAGSFTTVTASTPPATAPHLDSSPMTGLSVASGGNAAVAPAGTGYYLLFIAENAVSGVAAVYMLAGGTASLIFTDPSALWVASTTTPASGKMSVSGSGGTYKVYSNLASTGTFKVTLIKASS